MSLWKTLPCIKRRFEIVTLEVCDLGNMEVAVSPLSKWWIQLGDQSSETTRGNLSSHAESHTLRYQKDTEWVGGDRGHRLQSIQAWRQGGFPKSHGWEAVWPRLEPNPRPESHHCSAISGFIQLFCRWPRFRIPQWMHTCLPPQLDLAVELSD